MCALIRAFSRGLSRKCCRIVQFPVVMTALWQVAQIPVWAQTAATNDVAVLPVVTVTGTAEPVAKIELSNDPAANPASVTVLKFTDEQKRNTRNYEDLLKPIMGVASSNFDQGGIGFGFTMRGFSERSNGANVAYTLDGVPINLPSHPLSNGYGDLTPLIPELFDVLTLTRGPFDVRFGPNALGGSLQITTQDRPTRGATIAAGNHEFGRGVAALPFQLGSGVSGYASMAGSTTSGYRDNANVDQINTFNKLLFPLPGGTGSIRLQAFHDKFGAPGFLRRELVENGTLSPTTAINTTDGGKTDLRVLSFNYKQDGEQPFTAVAYVFKTQLDRFSNRTSTIPIGLDLAGQAWQVDDRLTFGTTFEKYFKWNPAAGMGADLLVGGGVRKDDALSRIYNTIRRNPTAQTEDTHFTLTNPFGYLQADFKPIPWVKLTGGYRYDRLEYDVADRTRNLSVSPTFGVSQPKAGIVVSPLKNLDLFANYGKSFLPPSAIGGQMIRNPTLEPPELTTKEIGFQFRSPDGVWRLLGDIYETKFTNEILNQALPLLPIYLGPSTRNGYDIELIAKIFRDGARSASVFVNYSKLKGELVGRASGTSIPDVADWLLKYGADVVWPLTGNVGGQVITFSIWQQWAGPRPLNAATTLTTKTFSRIDAKLSYTDKGRGGFSTFLSVVGYPDRRLEETAFTFGTPVTVGVSPKARLTVQGGVFLPF